jgi:hypothetical protein
MSKALWSITIMGFLTVVCMLIAMLFGVNQLAATPASNRIKLAAGVKDQFHFDVVWAEVFDESPKKILRVGFTTSKDSRFNTDFQNQEMKSVAEFASKAYDSNDRKYIDEIRIQRTEVKGNGCWQKSYVSPQFTMANPFKADTSPFSPFPAAPPQPAPQDP